MSPEENLSPMGYISFRSEPNVSVNCYAENLWGRKGVRIEDLISD